MFRVKKFSRVVGGRFFVHGAEQVHLEGMAESSIAHRCGAFGLEVNFERFDLGRAQEYPTAHMHVIQHLQQPLDFAGGDSHARGSLRGVETLWVGEEGVNELFVFAALLSERFIQETLIGFVDGSPMFC